MIAVSTSKALLPLYKTNYASKYLYMYIFKTPLHFLSIDFTVLFVWYGI